MLNRQRRIHFNFFEPISFHNFAIKNINILISSSLNFFSKYHTGFLPQKFYNRKLNVNLHESRFIFFLSRSSSSFLRSSSSSSRLYRLLSSASVIRSLLLSAGAATVTLFTSGVESERPRRRWATHCSMPPESVFCLRSAKMAEVRLDFLKIN